MNLDFLNENRSFFIEGCNGLLDALYNEQDSSEVLKIKDPFSKRMELAINTYEGIRKKLIQKEELLTEDILLLTIICGYYDGVFKKKENEYHLAIEKNNQVLKTLQSMLDN